MTEGDWKRADARHHDREASRYDDLIGREYAPYHVTHTAVPWARALAAERARVVLDIGGGTGGAALPIARRGMSVIVLDMSRGMLSRAREKAEAEGIRSVALVLGDAERLPFAGAAMDGVVCQGVLHHLPDVAAALAEADRVLRPGGRLFLAEPDRAGSVLSDAVRRAARLARPVVAALGIRRSPAASNERPLDPAALQVPLQSRGYEVARTHLVHPPYVYRFVPAQWAARVAARLNPEGAFRDRGDMVVVAARKPAATGTGASGGGVC